MDIPRQASTTISHPNMLEFQTSRCDVDRLVQICVSIVDSYLQQWRQGSAADEMNASIRWLEEPFFVEVL